MSNATNFQPNWASSPGETLVEILNEQNLSFSVFANKIGNTPGFVRNLIEGRISITDEIASQLEENLGTSASFWINREKQYREDLCHISRIKEDEWQKEFPVKEMIKFNWLPAGKNHLESLLSFFGVANIDVWQEKYETLLSKTSFRKSQKFSFEIGANIAWLRQGEIEGLKINCNKWDPEKFEKAFEQIKPLSRIKNPIDFIPKLKEICAKCGVSIAVTPCPKGIKASGATRFISDNKALIQLSFRYLSDDQFWFTFFHEAGHLLLHGDKRTIFIEDDHYQKIRVEEEEREANLFAGEVLVPESHRKRLATLQRNKRGIISFANEMNVSPGIIVGQLQFHEYISFKYLNSYKRRYSWDSIANL